MVFTDMSNMGMLEGMNKAASKLPVKEISSNIRTLRDRDGNRGSVIRVIRHALGRSIQGLPYKLLIGKLWPLTKPLKISFR